jgi:hypothetical protein
MMGLTQNDYQNAISVQDACNLSGVVRSWGNVVSRIWEEAREDSGRGTEWVNMHPINVMYASKVASLTGYEDMPKYSDAYSECRKHSEGA